MEWIRKVGATKSSSIEDYSHSNIFEPSMLVNVSDLSSTFQEIVQQNFQEKTAILILVAPDVDALCACRILTVRIICALGFVLSRSYPNSQLPRRCFALII